MQREGDPDFQYVRDIAEGSYGRVCLFRRKDKSYCAGKIVYRDRFASAEPYEREYEGVCRFREIAGTSPLLLQIIHVRRKHGDDHFCYMMELADDARDGSKRGWEGYVAKTLRWEIQYTGQRLRLPPEECIARILLVAEGLALLHDGGLIHRDVKPANIIYVDGVPKLADIGLVADSKSNGDKISATPAYEAPEGPVSKRSDIYSLGMMLYEMVTGRAPSQFPSLPDDIQRWPDRDQVLAIMKIVAKACEPDPRNRYDSVRRMRRDLESVSHGKHVRPSAGGAWFLRRIGVPVAAALLIFCAGGFFVSKLLKQRSFDSAVPGNLAEVMTPEENTEAASIRDRGIQAVQDGDYTRAKSLLLNASQLGDTTAMVELGNLYCLGLGIVEDEKEAEKWYKRAADKGDAQGEHNLEVLRNLREVRNFAKAGDADAQLKYAVMIANGEAGNRTAEEAAEWLQKSANQKQAKAMNELGTWYLRGNGVPIDEKKAREWIRKAADTGLEDAKHNLQLLDEMGVK